MSGIIALTSCLLFLPATVPIAGGDGKKIDRFDGKWELVGKQFAGKEESEEEMKKRQEFMIIKDGSCRIIRAGKLVARMHFTVSDNYDPPLILCDSRAEVEFGGGGSILWGVYELKGDTFRCCTAKTGSNCPKEFVTKVGDYATLKVYRRVKE